MDAYEDAHIYVLCSSPPELRALPFLEEYTLEWHREHYQAVRHISIKQGMYLAGAARYSEKQKHAGFDGDQAEVLDENQKAATRTKRPKKKGGAAKW